MNNQDGSRSFLTISPSNQNATISYRSGNPVINFTIGEQNRYLLGHSVRFTGNLSVYKTAVGEFGTIPLPANDLQISTKLGAYGMIDQITIASQKNHQVIENVKHFGRYLASYLPAVTSKEEAMNNYNSMAFTMPNVKATRLGSVANLNGSDATNRYYRGTSFALNLPTGFFNSGTPIPLQGNGGGTGGLEVSIHLAPDSQFLNGSWTNAFYQLTDVNLLCEVINPSVDELSRLMNTTQGSMEYNAITGYYQTIQSSNAILNLRLGLSRVLGFFINFIPSRYLNNLTFDGYQTAPLQNGTGSASGIAPIKSIVFLKGGNRLPLMYDLNANVRDDLTSTISDQQIFRNYMNAFGNFMNNVRTQQSPLTNNRLPVGANQVNLIDSGRMFGVGLSFDNISGNGVNFQNENLSVQMETGLDSGEPHSAFLFARSKQTLIFNEAGVRVLL